MKILGLILVVSSLIAITPPIYGGSNDWYYQQQINQLTQQLNNAQNTIAQLQYQLQFCGLGSSGPILGSSAPPKKKR